MSEANFNQAVEIVMTVDLGNEKIFDELRPKFPLLVTGVNTGPKTCVAGWNLAAKMSTGKILITLSDDFVPPEGWYALLRKVGPANLIEIECVIAVNDGCNPDLFAISILTRKRYERFGYVFYPGYESLFCTPAGTKIWMGDYTFQPVEKIRQGDEIIGSQRRIGTRGIKGQTREFLTRTKVLEVFSRMAPVVKLALESGKTLRCTADHLWAMYYNGWGYSNGKKVGPKTGGFEYCMPTVGRDLVHVIDIPTPPPNGFDRKLGWLGGLYDGEGTSGIFLTQSNTSNRDVCDEYERLLTSLGFQFSIAKSQSNYSQISGRQHESKVYTILGGKQEYVRLLNWTLPIRRNRPQIDQKLLTSRFGARDKIISIENDGIEYVFSLKTETKNYVADGYLSHNCDTEFSHVAVADEIVVDARHLLFEHKHYSGGKRAQDEVDIVHASQGRWTRGEALFNFRRSAGFPIDVGPVAEERYANPLKLGVIIQAIRDDFCLYEVIDRLLSYPHDNTVSIEKVYIFHPNKYWTGELTAKKETAEVREIAAKLSVKYPGLISLLDFEVDRVSNFNQPRIKTETDCRNWYQRIVRDAGIPYAIIMDGDELWKPGLLQRLCDYVRESGPNSVFTGMVPVAGLPGYPIEGALDKATILCRTNIMFKECRGAFGYRHELPGYEIYHFSATRRTLKEIADKHLNSGHGDDPQYDMKGWVDNVLMAGRIKPGLRNAHMFKGPNNIWPECRAWTKEEWAFLPDSVKPYLGPP